MISKCPLCESEKTNQFLECEKPFKSMYHRCSICDLIYTDRSFLLNQDMEKSRYDYHENNVDDVGYQNFLRRLIDPIQKYINNSLIGLDYGSGPEPALQELMKRDGYQVDIFDPIYANVSHADKYDFITSTEVVEHFYEPKKSFDHMLSHLKENGILAIMTSVYDDSIDFKTWHYRYDDTHVAFYTDKTLSWLASQYNLELLESKKNVRVWKKTIS